MLQALGMRVYFFVSGGRQAGMRVFRGKNRRRLRACLFELRILDRLTYKKPIPDWLSYHFLSIINLYIKVFIAYNVFKKGVN